MSGIYIPISALTERFNFSRFTDGQSRIPLASRFSNFRPLTEFFDVKRFSKPANWGEAQSRCSYNLSYFSSNYAAVFALLSIYSLLTNLMLLFIIAMDVGGMWFIGRLAGRDLELGFATFSPSQLYTGLVLATIVLSLFSSFFTTILWLIFASGIVVLGHASFMDKPIENAFSEEAV
ncbi:prenylated rab acceptor PRA1 [Peziza echinospora]|nr:prenylated rab acceptor PRA1 [Peziza echinospora]